MLEDKDFPGSNRSINPALHDFDAVEMDYCREHHINMAQLCARFESDDQLAIELYRLAKAAKLTRVKPAGGGGHEKDGCRLGGMGPSSAARRCIISYAPPLAPRNRLAGAARYSAVVLGVKAGEVPNVR